MTNEDFKQLFETRLDKLKSILNSKSAEYSVQTDKLHNFKESAHLIRCTPVQAAWAFAVKHLTSIKDMVDGLHPATPERLDEKITDAIAYLVLIEACLKESSTKKEYKPEEEPEIDWWVNCYSTGAGAKKRKIEVAACMSKAAAIDYRAYGDGIYRTFSGCYHVKACNSIEAEQKVMRLEWPSVINCLNCKWYNSADSACNSCATYTRWEQEAE